MYICKYRRSWGRRGRGQLCVSSAWRRFALHAVGYFDFFPKRQFFSTKPVLRSQGLPDFDRTFGSRCFGRAIRSDFWGQVFRDGDFDRTFGSRCSGSSNRGAFGYQACLHFWEANSAFLLLGSSSAQALKALSQDVHYRS